MYQYLLGGYVLRTKLCISIQGLLLLEFNSKIKLGDQNNLKYWGIYNLNSIIISRVLRFLTSQNRFQSLYDEIFVE